MFLPLGKVFHAIVSVTAVNIQFNSPRGVRRSFNCPGILKNAKAIQNIEYFTIARQQGTMLKTQILKHALDSKTSPKMSLLNHHLCKRSPSIPKCSGRVWVRVIKTIATKTFG